MSSSDCCAAKMAYFKVMRMIVLVWRENAIWPSVLRFFEKQFAFRALPSIGRCETQCNRLPVEKYVDPARVGFDPLLDPIAHYEIWSISVWHKKLKIRISTFFGTPERLAILPRLEGASLFRYGEFSERIASCWQSRASHGFKTRRIQLPVEKYI